MKPCRRKIRSCLRTKGRFERHGRRSAAGINDGVIEFTRIKSRRGDGDTDKDPCLKGAVYLNLEATDEFQSNFSGWVSPQVRALVYAAPGLQRKVYDYEEMIGKLLALLEADDMDGAMDVVRAEFDAIHGPAD